MNQEYEKIKKKNLDFDILKNFIRIYLRTNDNDDLWFFNIDRNLWPLTKESFMGYYVKTEEDVYYDFLIENSEYQLLYIFYSNLHFIS